MNNSVGLEPARAAASASGDASSRVVLFEHVPHLRDVIAAPLREARVAVREAASLAAAFEAARDTPYPVLLLSLADDGETAFGLLRGLRSLSPAPCVLLLGAWSEKAAANMLACGVDACLPRSPLNPLLVPLVQGALRRARAMSASGLAAPFGLGRWQLDLRRRRLMRPDGRDAQLTPREFDLFRILVAANGLTLTRAEIGSQLKGGTGIPDDRTVDNLVMRLRRKLGEAQQDAVQSVRGFGYRFVGFSD